MTHAYCLVIGPDVEAQMQPHEEAFHEDPDAEDGGYSTGHWDWWEIGGRWGDVLKLKAGATALGRGEILGQPHHQYGPWLKERGPLVQAAQARRGDIDFEAMEAEALQRAIRAWEVYLPALLTTPASEPWHVVYPRTEALRTEGRHPEANAMIDAYHRQPRVASWSAAWKAHAGNSWGPPYPVEDLGEDREEFLARQAAQAWTPHDFLYRGHWSQRPGRHEAGPDVYHAYADEIRSVVLPLPADEIVTVVDYHS